MLLYVHTRYVLVSVCNYTLRNYVHYRDKIMSMKDHETMKPIPGPFAICIPVITQT